MFKIHDIVFARLEGFPFWPAKVIPAEPYHLNCLGMHAIPPNQRLVLFYNDHGRYAAMDNSDLRNFDDPRIQRRTREYDGKYKSQLYVAFEAACEEHASSVTNSNKPKPTSSDLTSPVTGHSECRQTTLTKISKPPNQLTHRSASKAESPRNRSHQKRPANRPSQPPLPSPPQPPRSNKLQISHTPIPLRLRVKRKAIAPEHNETPSVPNHSSQLPECSSAQHSPKRRRLGKIDRPNTNDHIPTRHSDRHTDKELTTTYSKFSKLKERTEIEQVHKCSRKNIPEKPNATTDCNTRISGERERVRYLSDQKGSLHDDENRRHTPDDVPMPPRSRFERDESRGSGSEGVQVHSSSGHDSNQPYRRVEGKRFSKTRKRRKDHGDVDAEPEKKKMCPASKRSLSDERPRRNDEVHRNRAGDGHMKEDGIEKGGENRLSMELEQISKSAKQKKTDGSLDYKLSSLHRLSRGDCIELIERMQIMLRWNHVELWLRGYKLVDAKDIINTEEELIGACDSAIQKAEELLQAMKTESEEEKELMERELDVYEGCKGLKEIYFDKQKVSLKIIGKRILDIAKEMKPYSLRVSTVLRDVLVMWADLTNSLETISSGQMEKQLVEKFPTEKQSLEKRSSVKRLPEKRSSEKRSSEKRSSDRRSSERRSSDRRSSEKRLSEKRPPERQSPDEQVTKKSSAREERMLKFDRKTFFSAFESVLTKENGVKLRMDENERLRFGRRLEREIRPTFEDDRQGYYEASVKVIRGIQKALKHLGVKGQKDKDQNTYQHTTLFVDAVEDQSREKTKQLVNCLIL